MFESLQHKTIFLEYNDGYSSIGRTTVCGTVCSLFKSGYPSYKKRVFKLFIDVDNLNYLE